VITANTFRCNYRALRRAGLDAAGLGWMVHAAVGVAMAARNTAGSPHTRIVGSIAPVEDCYRPDLVPPDDELRTEHAWLATELVRAGLDVMLIETMNSSREARIALEQVLAAGGTAWVSFVCAGDARLLSGEQVAVAAAEVEADGAAAVLVNCTPLAQTERSLQEMCEVCVGPIGAYPNLEDRPVGSGSTHIDGYLPPAIEPEAFAEIVVRWRDEFHLAMVGGCCGSSPSHIAALNDQLGQ
jgi:S-methylmethionine-dependent homocysteine/selenocysteine methylase